MSYLGFYKCNMMDIIRNNRLEDAAASKVRYQINAGQQTHRNDCLKAIGERLVFALKSLLKDCECSNPSS